ncbi:exodeoxyribonuclease V subunit alpha [Thermomonas carbonis]|uniref:RecBCD enzyme subunit RecD n=1 Tax=Thermomonas carbonis TaxID=1463158 RepID=A0A7G9ST42_9GAMM|nr:exodeoxyribonuclease V subunit alpha [Thermomonas carbonis]QNN71017.1 exodeoxyribonuclease V subunit alpha [Thermomonas carbonis]GHC03955.1 RecBCD enzyme subunit RecD [Thermomonas carbonis]
MSLLRALQQAGVLRTLDDALANTMRRLDPDTPDDVLAAAALASLAVAQGHAGFDPASPRQLVDADIAWPDAEAWRQQLAASRFVATPASPIDEAQTAPLVLDNGLLYLRRYREYERRLAMQLRRIASAPNPEIGIEPIALLFATLFPDAHSGDHQARAAALALRRALLLVTGGPGTGKTTTIARLLTLRVAQASRAGTTPPRIALAAPTGRAAERMAESLRRAVAQMAEQGIGAALLEALPAQASTLHRLLGTVPDSPRFRHNKDNPLPFDIVVVDEASMVDLPLMCKLTEAVADGAQLVLLGDPDQLPSVEAGDVLAAILGAAGAGDALSMGDAAALHPLLGDVPVDAGTNHLVGHRVHLQHGWRQSEALHLAPLAEAVRNGDALEALSLLRGGTLSNVHFHEGVDDPLQARPDLLAHFRTLATHTDPAQALRQGNRLRLLTALREGPSGARGLNARIEVALSGRRIGTPPAWFPGRLLLITENSYRHGLFNGDVGICLADADGTPLAWFSGEGSDHVRAFHPAALPAHESAFAMTVHKAQGSEFDEVWLQLPRADSRVLSRELLYTGLTRARSALHVAGTADVIAAALARHAGRVSGLGWRLGATE